MIQIYDTTLRDGVQAEDISFLVEDKLRIVQKLDELGIAYVEGGWPGANPRDVEFFKEARNLSLKTAKIAAFGSTCHPNHTPDKDPVLQALLDAETPTVTIFGKTWDFHVREALRVPLEKNLEIIRDSIAWLKSHGREVFFDCEHFFNGFLANCNYALQVVKTAEEAGADCIVLCDTNGGMLPEQVAEIVRAVRAHTRAPLGIHAHNDSDTGVANSLAAVRNGATQVQGTINGYGERCGNANLCSIIPNIQLKMKIGCLPEGRLPQLKEVSRFVDELANLSHNKHQPYVGDSAFAHKGGIHVSAVQRNPETYEHVRPEVVGNAQRILVSDQAGKSNILGKAAEFGIDIDHETPQLRQILGTVKELESLGFAFEGAEASFELLMKRALGSYEPFFELIGFRLITENRGDGGETISEATIQLKVGDEVEHTAAIGNGPVNAMDKALRKALEPFYPHLREMDLIDFKVRVLAGHKGTAAKVRVLIESGDGEREWGTVGASENIIEASWTALVDSVEYKLLKDLERSRTVASH
ncbi:MAG: citramalate synthase [Nitrospirota bacterium]|nr:citramalate synthase [Nitrospirota bacterium]